MAGLGMGRVRVWWRACGVRGGDGRGGGARAKACENQPRTGTGWMVGREASSASPYHLQAQVHAAAPGEQGGHPQALAGHHGGEVWGGVWGVWRRRRRHGVNERVKRSGGRTKDGLQKNGKVGQKNGKAGQKNGVKRQEVKVRAHTVAAPAPLLRGTAGGERVARGAKTKNGQSK